MISSLDHSSRPCDLDATARFYVEGLGMELREFGEGRHGAALRQPGRLTSTSRAMSSSRRRLSRCRAPLTLCFLTERSLAEIEQRLVSLGCPLLEGPVARTGATGPLRSIYVRDPDGNLIEIARRE